jgi:hypothetical protein
VTPRPGTTRQPDNAKEIAMDPNTGRLFPSLADAKMAGVRHAVELDGRREDVERIAAAVAATWTREQKATRNAKQKAAKKARRAAR